MANIALSILSIIFVLWVYTIFTIINSSFKHQEAKTFWLIAVIFVPLVLFFYHFKKKDLLEQ